MSRPCESVRERLVSYQHDALAASERAEVRDHLRACADCRAQATAFEPALLFAGLPSPAVSAEEVRQVAEGVRASLALRQAEAKLGRRRGRLRRRAARIASVAALAALAFFLLPRTARREGLPPLRPSGGTSPLAPAVRSSAPGGVTVYEWQLGPGPQEPRVVWIVNRSLDI